MNKVRIKILEDSHFVIRRLVSKNINIYDIKYGSDGITYTIDYDSLDSIPFDYEIISFNGIKKLIYLVNSNKHFLICILISIFLIIFSSNIIVSIDVVHNDSKVRELILDELYENNVHPIMFKKTYSELQTIKKNIKEKYRDKIEWLEIIDNGMNYTIKVEKRIINKKEDKPLSCDIVSDKDAVIISSEVTSGEGLVEYNDYVKKGSVLISGTIKKGEEVKGTVCADGVVYGNTWYTINVSVPLKKQEKEYTGKKKGNISFEYGSTYTPLFKVHFDKYEFVNKKIFSIGRFTLYKSKALEYKEKEMLRSVEEAKKEAVNLGRKKIVDNLDKSASILYEKVLQSHEYNSIIDMEIFYSVKEIISRKVEG